MRKIRNMVEKDSEIIHINIHLIKKDGSIIPVDFRASVIHDEEGNPKQIMDTMTDLTLKDSEERKDEKATSKSSDLLDSLFSAVLEFDKSGKISYVNNYTSQLSGYSANELMRMSITKLFESDTKDSKSIISYFADKLHTKSEPSVWNGKLVKKKVEQIPVLIKWNYIKDEYERIIGFVGVVNEV